MSGLVYFSSVSENTERFVERLELPALRIPLHPHREGMPQVTEPYVLIVPTYGGGSHAGAVPKQVIRFLNVAANRALLRGVIASGNTNFGADYCLAGRVISAKCGVPQLYRFELLGTDHDVRAVREGLQKFWTRHSSAKASAA
ncbi:class Ib ribonucleoside-diphosphate reductase assembly flavoprotein NrdI [Streptomyces sp. AV19]|uniref:class Ib ribonucleoside-diphosphate reductase assembly flavoprotein NrdI n=1 Tax=Streptomyces sp. AV19 TaxID=2793068 RepID=UPI0018FEFFE1|nr:class Ib ribonucleoside-diphosphate reductase assembly flavoprotein NrdI [Streptomyces sp. AV19]MBH1937707.1 class Ib ribonucleoside-diphosphate reductase assembly flavoprotein NrdI [Streptomyces sp. AV19]MDG4536375.1 class Ib ribonucleoside-diphosphate reductase assembly flavoprotein NrdI [Streptomyces sp. AV19]